jgi:hypothetical protein
VWPLLNLHCRSDLHNPYPGFTSTSPRPASAPGGDDGDNDGDFDDGVPGNSDPASSGLNPARVPSSILCPMTTFSSHLIKDSSAIRVIFDAHPYLLCETCPTTARSRSLACTLQEIRVGAPTYPLTLPASCLQRDHEQNHRRMASGGCSSQNLVPSSFDHGVGSNGTEPELRPFSSRTQPSQHGSEGVSEGIGPCLGAMTVFNFRRCEYPASPRRSEFLPCWRRRITPRSKIFQFSALTCRC